MRISRCLALLSAAVTSTLAASNGSSEFFYTSGYANLSLSLTAVAETGDIFFRWLAPSEYDWVAFGIGSQMKGSFSVVMYTAKNGSAVTISPRLASGHVEPAYAPNVVIERIDIPNEPTANSIDTSNGGYMRVSAVCRKCASLSTPPLDLSSSTAPFMFAIGPVNDGTSTRNFDELNAPLRGHSLHGQFTMDMRQATVQSAKGVTVPSQNNATSGASSIENLTYSPHDYSSAAHAAILCLAIGLLLPLDAVLQLVFDKRRAHLILQGLFGLLFVVGLALGFYVSTYYQRSKTMSSGHQILGILLLILWIAQSVQSYLYHRRQVTNTTQQPRPTPKIFTLTLIALTALLFILGIAPASTGFNFALSPSYNRAWIPLVLGVAILLSISAGIKYCWKTSKQDKVDERQLERETADKWAQYYAEREQGHQEYEMYQQGLAGKQGGVRGTVVEVQPKPQQRGGAGAGGVHYETVHFPKAY